MRPLREDRTALVADHEYHYLRYPPCRSLTCDPMPSVETLAET
jgi:hypothetical protein